MTKRELPKGRLCECGHLMFERHFEREVHGDEGFTDIVYSCWDCDCRDAEDPKPMPEKKAARRKK